MYLEAQWVEPVSLNCHYVLRKLYTEPAICASNQVSVHLANWFQRRGLKCEKLMDDGQRTPSDGKSSLCLYQGELKWRHLTNKQHLKRMEDK